MDTTEPGHHGDTVYRRKQAATQKAASGFFSILILLQVVFVRFCFTANSSFIAKCGYNLASRCRCEHTRAGGRLNASISWVCPVSTGHAAKEEAPAGELRSSSQLICRVSHSSSVSVPIRSRLPPSSQGRYNTLLWLSRSRKQLWIAHSTQGEYLSCRSRNAID